MSDKLKGKVAIVTGASKGIGASIAKYLAAEGASIVVNYSSSKDGADRVVSEIKNKGGKVVLYAPSEMVEKVLKTSGIDSIIPIHHDLNNAVAALQ